MSDDETTPAEDLEDATEPVAGASEPAVTVRQAARALGLTREHVYARIRAGSIRAIDGPGAKGQGTVRLVPLAEIERLVVEQGPRRHGEVKPDAPDSRPILQLERVTQRLESTRAVLSDAMGVMAEPDSGPWWGRRKRERERLARMEAALRAAHAAADAGASEDTSE
jgi:excisionase family DNA binding protein